MNTNNKKIIFLVGLAIFIILFAFSYKKHSGHAVSRVVLNGKIFSAETVNTTDGLNRGLSGHAPLSDSQGMLFVFSKPGNYGFWMKGMTFPLDIIWFNRSFQVVHIEKSLLPSTYPEIFYPQAEAMYVLEVNAGQADGIDLRLGDNVIISS